MTRRAGRVGYVLVVVLAVTTITFLMQGLVPGDPATTLLGYASTPEALTEVRNSLGLDKPLMERYLSWLVGLASGDLGRSFRSRAPVGDLLIAALPVSLQLMVYSTVTALLVSVPLAIISAYRPGSIFDRVSSALAYGLLAIPHFVLAIIAILVFSVQLGLFPAASYIRFSADPFGHIHSMTLPTLTLAAGQIAVYLRILRSDLISTLQDDFITMARSKGLPPRQILVGHALRPSLLTLLTVLGVTIGHLIGGAVIIETIFSLPGIGRLLVDAIHSRDYMVIQGGVLLVAVGFVLVNALVDGASARLDPRIAGAGT